MKKIKTFLSNLWFKYIIEPKLKKQRAIKNSLLKKEFEEKQKTSIDRVKELIITHENYDEITKRKYLNEKLVEGRAHVNKMSNYLSNTPFLYEPEICNEHNESNNLNVKDIIDIKKDELFLADTSLKLQEANLNKVKKINKKNLVS